MSLLNLRVGLVAALLASACGPDLGGDPGGLGFVHQGLSLAGPVEVGFNAPEGLTDPLGDDLVAYVDGAEETLDAALYKVTHRGVVDALLRAHERGVRVRMVSDTKHRALKDAGPIYEELEAAGIPIVFDERKADMHNKFVVRDGLEVWLGSYNPLQMSTTHAEDALTVLDADFAAAYTVEFEEMFVDRRFNRSKADNTAHEFVVDGVRLESYFAPTDGVEERVVDAVMGARHSVRFLAFSFSADPIAEALLERQAAGVEVSGAVDRLQANKRGGDFRRLLAAGMDVRRTPFLTMMHHKFMVIDGGTADAKVITGSYNFTRQAGERNDENVVVVHSAETAHAYLAAFHQVFGACARLNADSAVGADLRITEVHANPLDERRGEFVEIVNASDEAASVLGLYLYDGDAWDRVVVADGGPPTLAPWEVAVIADPDRDGSTPAIAAGARHFTVENGTLGDGLTNRDPVSLFGPDREVAIDRYSFPSNPGDGRSIYRRAADAPDEAASWLRGERVHGSPGVFPEPAHEPADEPADALVDVNVADAYLLDTLPGVGPSTAARIVVDRRTRGVFCTIDELARVPGVGPATVAGVRPFATVGEAASAADQCATSSPPDDARTDINSAGLAELDTLPGIGPRLAGRIVADREVRGPFPSACDITRVVGVGEKTYARIFHLIVAR